MKKKTIVLIATLLLLSVSFSGLAGYAIGQNEVVANLAKHYNVTKEGRALDLGDDVPLVYNNRTYLPVRAVSEGLGFDIEWFANSNTVNITTPEKEYPLISLDGIEIVEATKSLDLMSNTAIQKVTVIVNQTKDFTHEPILVLEILRNGVVVDSKTLKLERTSGRYIKDIKSSQFSHGLGSGLNSDERLERYNKQYSYRLKIK